MTATLALITSSVRAPEDFKLTHYPGNAACETRVMPVPRYDPNLVTEVVDMRTTWPQPNPEADLIDYLCIRGGLSLAYAFASLFVPRFVEVDGELVLETQYWPSQFQRWKQHFGGDARAAARMVNHTHLEDLFLNRPDNDIDDPVAWRALGEALLISWRAALREQFPGRPEVVELVEDPAGVLILYVYRPDS